LEGSLLEGVKQADKQTMSEEEQREISQQVFAFQFMQAQLT